MAVRIKFDNENNVISPTIVLATRSGNKLGVIPAYSISVTDAMNAKFEMAFTVSKYDNGKELELWDSIIDLGVIAISAESDI